MRLLSIFILILGLYLSALGQQQYMDWAYNLGGVAVDRAENVELDQNGFPVIIGTFSNSIDIDPGSGTLLFSSQGNQDVYIQKVNKEGELIWAKQIGGPFAENVFDHYVDSNGNILIAGIFRDSVDFDPGPNTSFAYGSKSPSGYTTYDMFLLSLDSSGDFNWVHTWGDSNVEYINSIATDAQGNIYLAGHYRNAFDADPGAGLYMLNHDGLHDSYVMKLNSNRQFLWAKTIGGIQNQSVESMSLDPQGNIILVGQFSDSTDFDPGIGTQYRKSFDWRPDIFCLKLDSSGNYLWVKTFGGAANEISYDFVIDREANIYISGIFSAPIDLDPDSGTYMLTGHGSSGLKSDVFIVKLDSSGAFQWGGEIGGNGWEGTQDMGIDDSSNIYITGWFSGFSIDFDISLSSHVESSNGGTDAFLLKMSKQGLFQNVYVNGSIGTDQADDVTVDENFSIYNLGSFNGSFDVNPFDSVRILSSNGSSDAWVRKISSCITNIDTIVLSVCDSVLSPSGRTYYTSTGTYIDSLKDQNGCDSLKYVIVQVDSSPADPQPWPSSVCDSGYASLAVFAPGTTPYWFFNVNDSIPFDTGHVVSSPYIDTSTTYYVQSYFGGCYSSRISALAEVHHSNYLEYQIESCIEYVSEKRNLDINESGIYQRTFSNQYSCDSIETYNISIIPVEVSVTQNYDTLTVVADSVSYQWLEYDQGYSVINGANSKSYVGIYSRQYAVEVTNDSCVDTSEVKILLNTSINQLLNNRVRIYPNPTLSFLSIDTSNWPLYYTVRSSSGQIIKEGEVTQHSNRLKIDGNSGLYFIDLRSKKEFIGSYKVIKE